MSIRSGGRPRGDRPPAPYDADAYATESIPPYSQPYVRGGRNGGGGGGGLLGLLKFLVFALVLGGIVLAASLTVLRPIINSAVISWASDNPGALSFPFVKDIVREDLGSALTSAASTDDEQMTFVVNDGDTATSIARRLELEGFLTDARAFVFIAIERRLTGELKSGEFILRRSQTPDQLVSALLDPPRIQYVDIALRSQLRLEQVVAKLETIDGLTMDIEEFHELASRPPAELLEEYPWLQTILAGAPQGIEPSLEGFLWPATYRVLPDTSAEELVRLMLDKFAAQVGEGRWNVPADRGLSFFEVLTLASIVEREAVLNEEKPKIAGVYQNRLDGIKGVKNRILNADPTVIYAVDTVALSERPIEEWREYSFWNVPEVGMKDVVLPESLAGFQTYTVPGLPPWPISTPTVTSIDAALEPDTADGYIYFLAIPDSDPRGQHAFAKTAKEHQQNRQKYGYNA
jgi:UPF0755 protein